MSASPLFICRSSAWTPESAACLEVVLTAGVFDQQPVLVLVDAAVTLLLPDQQGEILRLKTAARQLPALELYGVSSLWVDAVALSRYGVDHAMLPQGARVIVASELSTLIAQAGTVMVF